MAVKKFKASVLVVTLIVLGIILVTALSVSLTSLKQRTASMGESKTGVAFQNAQSGIEIAMDAILQYSKTEGDNPTLYTAYDLSSFGLTCSDPVGEELYAKLDPGGDMSGKFTVEIKGNNDAATTCSTNVVDIAAIKSVGSDAGQKRAIEAVVASTNGPDWQNSTWEAISNTDGYKEWTYSSGTSWYPSNCMAWFSTSATPSGAIYPMDCMNNPAAGDNQQGWKVDGTKLRVNVNSGIPILKYWNGSSFDSWNSGYIKVMLWK